jgi:hypothetical protein
VSPPSLHLHQDGKRMQSAHMLHRSPQSLKSLAGQPSPSVKEGVLYSNLTASIVTNFILVGQF